MDVEKVNHPKHYNEHPSGVECIEIIRHFDFDLGNVIKYVWRAGRKPGEEALIDLKKALFYLKDKIDWLERNKDDDNNRDGVIKDCNKETVQDSEKENTYASTVMQSLLHR